MEGGREGGREGERERERGKEEGREGGGRGKEGGRERGKEGGKTRERELLHMWLFVTVVLGGGEGRGGLCVTGSSQYAV